MAISNRWVLLKHIGAPDDLLGIHFDLLIQDISACRTWRLNQIPTPMAHVVEAIRLPSHSLRWLDIKESILSKGRGYVERIDLGIYKGNLPKEEGADFQIEIFGN